MLAFVFLCVCKDSCVLFLPAYIAGDRHYSSVIGLIDKE